MHTQRQKHKQTEVVSTDTYTQRQTKTQRQPEVVRTDTYPSKDEAVERDSHGPDVQGFTMKLGVVLCYTQQLRLNVVTECKEQL